jgi:hypothetical protein
MRRWPRSSESVSVLVLDRAEHLRQRRLLLPPPKGSAVHNSRAREVA